ncbi:hypothetical protein [Bradyrhizobium zhanjiangense]|uniref:hypothetical protein n=1 Tax=Bradyrhizobium zhanjiangense TaxID=1325107 RepID=UPI001009371B|nr:hypothetical protein [Bradyrhizobium zhanjiangense]
MYRRSAIGAPLGAVGSLFAVRRAESWTIVIEDEIANESKAAKSKGGRCRFCCSIWRPCN